MVTTSDNEVADILLQLPTLISEFEYRGSRLPFSWGLRRKRSKIPAVTTSPSSSPPPPPLKAAKSPSPATPLSFSPSDESDHNQRKRTISLKRKREHYLKIVNELSKHNDLLQGEIKNVKSYFEKLKDFNLKLKAKKLELSFGLNPKQPQLQPGVVQHLPLIHNRTVEAPRISGGENVTEFQGTASLGVGSNKGGANSNQMGPTGIPDLNEPVILEEGQSCEKALDANPHSFFTSTSSCFV